MPGLDTIQRRQVSCFVGEFLLPPRQAVLQAIQSCYVLEPVGYTTFVVAFIRREVDPLVLACFASFEVIGAIDQDSPKLLYTTALAKSGRNVQKPKLALYLVSKSLSKLCSHVERGDAVSLLCHHFYEIGLTISRDALDGKRGNSCNMITISI